jgi:glutamyl-tRNA synthetase
LFNWLYARHHGGKFLLRIEDTDRARSTQPAIDAILTSMRWLGLDWDGEEVFQFARAARHAEVAYQLLAAGQAYKCFATADELTEMREAQKAAGKPMRYDGRWRDRSPDEAPEGAPFVVRLKAPREGATTIEDRVQGSVTVQNAELDDFVLLRSDGTPTYMLAVVVDDHDMGVTHIIRGDDHLNNAFRQLPIMRAMNAIEGGWPDPVDAHIPLIHGSDGAKMSKRHGAVSVMDYPAQGYLPEAMLNYLARLGWSHGDDEIFSMQQFCEWFDLDHLTKAPAQFNPEKLNWLNNHYIKLADNTRLAGLVRPLLEAQGAVFEGAPDLAAVIGLLKDRANTVNEIAAAALMFYRQPAPDAALVAQHITDAIKPALADFAQRVATVEWTKEAIAPMIKEVLAAHGIKMPQLAMPLRLIVAGQLQTPAIDAVLQLFGREAVRARLAAYV